MKRYIKNKIDNLPSKEALGQMRIFKLFGKHFHNSDLWHFKRQSVCNAMSVGLFAAFVPMPFQMVLAGALAIIFRVNVPISMALVWITNPLTIPPVFYGTYKIGTWLMQTPIEPFEFTLSFEWFTQGLANTWQPLLLGSLFVGVILAILGNIVTRLIWRMSITRRWRRRTLARQVA